MKSTVQNALRHLGVYERVKHSRAYGLYWSLAPGDHVAARRRERAFYAAVLPDAGKGGLIFDIGANEGAKTAVFLELGATVVAVDPDPVNVDVLRRSFTRLRLRPRPVRIVNKAVAETIGRASFWISAPGSAKNTLSSKWVDVLARDATRFGTALSFDRRVEVETTTLQALIEEFGVPTFVKIDVEGLELSVLRGLKQPVPCLSFEVNLPEFLEEGVQCIECLASLAPAGRFLITIDCTRGKHDEQWLGAAAAIEALRGSTVPSVEIFWRSHVRAHVSPGTRP